MKQRLLLVGGGVIAAHYRRAFASSRRYRLCALADIDEKCPARVLYHVPFYTDARRAEGKIKVYLLGFGQLIYTGGKPQFYFTVVIDKDVDLSALNAGKKDKEKLDYNKKMVEAERIDLKNENGYVLSLTLKNGKRMKGEAEKSFFIALWHMRTQKRIEGVPDWAYE